MFPLMARNSYLVKKAVKLADNGVDLLGQVASIHIGGCVLMILRVAGLEIFWHCECIDLGSIYD